ncbi:MAG: hypothetical protein RMJ67_09685, partial [Elusimicrobiota bacterium]|nr:hypothetical protein [Endomicrobiia bacterium]MDW8166766.1 hypothetical protein [Elusimicrobiota bacterium]
MSFFKLTLNFSGSILNAYALKNKDIEILRVLKSGSDLVVRKLRKNLKEYIKKYKKIKNPRTQKRKEMLNKIKE